MRKQHKLASQFQELALHLEKSLGLGGKKTTRFIEKLSKNISPLLDKMESTILLTKSLPLGMTKSMLEAYLKQIAQDAGVSIGDFKEVFEDCAELIQTWFRPQEWFSNGLQLTQNLIFQGNTESEVDEFGMDQAFVESVRPLFEFLYGDYWRVEVKGVENIPKSGRCLLVSNHSGVVPYDGAMIRVACLNEHPGHRNVRFLIEDFVYHFPFLGTFMSRIGAVRACPENATWLLRKGQLVLVFPEGVKGLGKLYAERYQLQRFGRGGYIKLAMLNKAPIVPVSVIGAEEIHPTIWKSSLLAKAMNVPYLPVTPTFPWLGLMGAIPLPTKWIIQFGKPIPFKQYKSSDTNNGLLVQRLNENVRNRIQKMITTNLKKRKSVWLG